MVATVLKNNDTRSLEGRRSVYVHVTRSQRIAWRFPGFALAPVVLVALCQPLVLAVYLRTAAHDIHADGQS